MSAGLPVEEYDTEYSVSPLRRLSTSTGQIAAQAAGRLRCALHWVVEVLMACDSVSALVVFACIEPDYAAQQPGCWLACCTGGRSDGCGRGGLAFYPAVSGCQRDSVHHRSPRHIIFQPPGELPESAALYVTNRSPPAWCGLMVQDVASRTWQVQLQRAPQSIQACSVPSVSHVALTAAGCRRRREGRLWSSERHRACAGQPGERRNPESAAGYRVCQAHGGSGVAVVPGSCARLRSAGYRNSSSAISIRGRV